MFVQFTKKDGMPVWINANFVVTVESVRTGGAIVVPVGDGLDYEVREEPEKVVETVTQAQGAVAVVPVPNADPLGGAKKKRTTRKTAAKTPEDGKDAPPAEEKPAAKAEQKRRTKKEDVPAQPPAASASATPAASAPAAPAAQDISAAPSADAQDIFRPPALDLNTEALDRLRTMAPRSVKKVVNTLKAQFDVKDPEATVSALAANGLIEIGEHNRVTWLPTASPSSVEVSIRSTTGTSES